MSSSPRDVSKHKVELFSFLNRMYAFISFLDLFLCHFFVILFSLWCFLQFCIYLKAGRSCALFWETCTCNHYMTLQLNSFTQHNATSNYNIQMFHTNLDFVDKKLCYTLMQGPLITVSVKSIPLLFGNSKRLTFKQVNEPFLHVKTSSIECQIWLCASTDPSVLCS